MPACRVTAAVAAGQAARAGNARSGSVGAGGSFKPVPQRRTPTPTPPKKDDGPPKPLWRRVISSILEFLDQTWLQTLQYIVFLVAFQSLTGTIRKPSEFYFDKYLTDTFIVNTFDAAHNRFADVRRISDIWEWGDNVLVPGLFSNADEFELWPDGDGPFSLRNATPLSTSEVVDSFNVMSFAHGVVFKQVRAEPVAGRACYASHTCYSTVGVSEGSPGDGSREAFGYGASEDAFSWFSPEELGANPAGITSASPISQRQFPSGGYVALYKPFFSDTLLPYQSGDASQVTDHRLHEATPGNGKAPTYYCARSSFNGVHIEQRCNPDPASNDAVARTMMSDMLQVRVGGARSAWPQAAAPACRAPSTALTPRLARPRPLTAPPLVARPPRLSCAPRSCSSAATGSTTRRGSSRSRCRCATRTRACASSCGTCSSSRRWGRCCRATTWRRSSTTTPTTRTCSSG